MTTELDKVAEYWSTRPTLPQRVRWWQSPAIVRHINRRIAGTASEGTAGGDCDLLKQLTRCIALDRGISVGCGTAAHEIHLLQHGVVQHFDLYEIAAARVERILHNARRANVQDRITIHSCDPFEHASSDCYDLIYWKDALHHMHPVLDAVCWSRRVLKEKGLFFMNECVAPTYMQWTDRQLQIVSNTRRLLPDRYLANPRQAGQLVSIHRARPNISAIRASDPSECIDSGNIIPSVKATFQNATIIPTGGVIYSLTLNDILANIDENGDEGMLAALMALDDLYSDMGEFIYAVAYARKESTPALPGV